MATYLGKESVNVIIPRITNYSPLNIHLDETNPPLDTTKLWIKKSRAWKVHINCDDVLTGNALNITTDTDTGGSVKLINSDDFVYTTTVTAVEDKDGSVDSYYYDTTTEDWEEI